MPWGGLCDQAQHFGSQLDVYDDVGGHKDKSPHHHPGQSLPGFAQSVEPVVESHEYTDLEANIGEEGEEEAQHGVSGFGNEPR